MAWISFGAMHCRKRNLMTARVSILLKSRASLTCFQACVLPGRANDLSAPGHYSADNVSMWGTISSGLYTVTIVTTADVGAEMERLPGERNIRPSTVRNVSWISGRLNPGTSQTTFLSNSLQHSIQQCFVSRFPGIAGVSFCYKVISTLSSVCSNGGMVLTGDTKATRSKTYPSNTSSTANLTWNRTRTAAVEQENNSWTWQGASK